MSKASPDDNEILSAQDVLRDVEQDLIVSARGALGARTHDFKTLLEAAGLHKIGVSGKDWSGVDFSGDDLSGISFADCNLLGARFDGADIAGCDFRGSKYLPEAFAESRNADRALFSKDFPARPPKVLVIGVGACGQSLVTSLLIGYNRPNIDFYVLDVGALSIHTVKRPEFIGLSLPVDSSAKTSRRLSEILRGVDTCLILAEIEGDVAANVAAQVAAVAKARGARAIGLLANPLGFEGESRGLAMSSRVRAFRKLADMLVVLDSRKCNELFSEQGSSSSMVYAMNQTARLFVHTMADIAADSDEEIKHILQFGGESCIGMGEAGSILRATSAAVAAVRSQNAQGLASGRMAVVSIWGQDATKKKAREATKLLCSMMPHLTTIKVRIKTPRLGGAVRVVVIVSGYNDGD